MTQETNLLVVYDPLREDQPALERARAIALRVPATIHLFACVHADSADQAATSEDIQALISARQVDLDRLAADLVERGIAVTTEVDWDNNWTRAVVRASKKRGADVVLKSSFKHSTGQRIFNRTSDWTLTRECLCPVMLVKEELEPVKPRVLAAVDICATNESYEQLNRNVIGLSQRILSGHGAEVHYVNAFQDFKGVPDRQALVEHCATDSERVHIKLGKPYRVIADQAKRLDANLVVVGNSARSGISGALMGNTVEKVLDRVECDVLSVPV